MQPRAYAELLEQAGKLELAEQLRLLEELAALIRKSHQPEGSYSPLELLGLGKEVWRDEETGELIDAQEYVNRERTDREPHYDITELRGLGKEVWRDEETGGLIDAQEYVNRERASWGG